MFNSSTIKSRIQSIDYKLHFLLVSHAFETLDVARIINNVIDSMKPRSTPNGDFCPLCGTIIHYSDLSESVCTAVGLPMDVKVFYYANTPFIRKVYFSVYSYSFAVEHSICLQNHLHKHYSIDFFLHQFTKRFIINLFKLVFSIFFVFFLMPKIVFSFDAFSIVSNIYYVGALLFYVFIIVRSIMALTFGVIHAKEWFTMYPDKTFSSF